MPSTGVDKQDVLFVVDRINMDGGVSRSLRQLLGLLPAERATYHLFVTSGQDVSGLGLPEHVEVVVPDAASVSSGLRTALPALLRRGRGWRAARLLGSAAAFKMTGDRGVYLRRLSRLDVDPNRAFDVAISYGMLDAYCNAFVAHRVRASRKFMWCHINATLYTEGELDGMEAVYGVFDQVVCVGPSARESFDEAFPEMARRTLVADNVLDEEAVRERARAFSPTKRAFTLCTVGRVTQEKGTDLVAAAARLLAERGIDFEWWVIGPPFDEEFAASIRADLQADGLEESVLLMGSLDNPHPYVAACDAYVQPSRYEGSPLALREARALGKVLVATPFAGAAEHVHQGINGLLTDMTATSLADALQSLADGSVRIEPPPPPRTGQRDSLRLIDLVLGSTAARGPSSS